VISFCFNSSKGPFVEGWSEGLSSLAALGLSSPCSCRGLGTRRSTRYLYLSFWSKVGERRSVILS
jgi:hypothetical protein